MTKYYSRSKGKFIDIANMPDQYVRNAFVKMCSTDAIEDVIYATQQKERADLNSYRAYKYKKLAEDNFASSVDDLDKNEIMVVSLTKERDDYKKKANDMEMAKMNINRELLDVKDKLKDTVSKCNSQLANAMPLESWKKINNQCEELQLENVRLVQQLEHDETVVSKEVYQAIFDKCQKLEEDYKYANDRMMNYATMLNNKCPKGDVKMFSEIPNTDDGWEFVSKLKRYLNKQSYKIRVRGQYLDDETKKNEGWQRYSFGQPIEKSKCLRVYVDINNDK